MVRPQRARTGHQEKWGGLLLCQPRPVFFSSSKLIEPSLRTLAVGDLHLRQGMRHDAVLNNITHTHFVPGIEQAHLVIAQHVAVVAGSGRSSESLEKSMNARAVAESCLPTG